MHGQGMPESFTKGQQIAQLQGKPLLCFGPQHPFQRYGQSGIEISARLPHIGGIIDDLCLVRSLWTEQINHDPAHTLMNTGSILAGRPSMGSWAVYGLGTEAKDLPGYVVLVSNGRGGQAQPIAARQWSAGMLPSKFQGVKFQSVGDPVLYIDNPPGMNARLQQRLRRSDHGPAAPRAAVARRPRGADPHRAIRNGVPHAIERPRPDGLRLRSPPACSKPTGAKPGDGSFASNCLLARRLAERGVRFIQLYHRDWDHHGNDRRRRRLQTDEVDRPTAALIRDLKQRGMLDDTLVIWGGEFGRTPMSQGGDGRDHHIKGFSYLLAGGGIRPGTVYGATDELGYAAVENPVSVHDLHATMLHLLGINHLRLTVKYQGLDVRLTGISGEVVKGILA
jgi:hypothetical protein